MKTKSFGFSIPEMLVTMLILGVLMVLTIPVFMPNREDKTGVDKDAFACVVTQQAATLKFTSGNFFNEFTDASPACQNAMTKCIYNRGNACTTFKHYFVNGDSAVSEASRKALRATCDLGGSLACKYFAENICIENPTNCDIADSDIDLNFYLVQRLGQNSKGLLSIFDITNYYYKQANNNIKTAVDTACPYCQNKMACSIRFSDCGWIKKLTPKTTPSIVEIDFKIDNEGNTYILAKKGGDDFPIFIKINNNGMLIFSKKLSTKAHNGQILLYDSKKIFVAYNDTNDDQIKILQFSPSGKLMKMKKLTGVNQLSEVNIARDASGNIIIRGATGKSIFIAKFNSNLDLLWINRYNNPTISAVGGSNGVNILVIDENDIYTVATYRYDTLFFKINSAGTPVWIKSYKPDYTDSNRKCTHAGINIFNTQIYTILNCESGDGTYYYLLAQIPDIDNPILTETTTVPNTYNVLSEIDNDGNFYLNGGNKLNSALDSINTPSNTIVSRIKNDPRNTTKVYFTGANNGLFVGKVSTIQQTNTPFLVTAPPMSLEETTLSSSITTSNLWWAFTNSDSITITDYPLTVEDPDLPDIAR